MISATRYLSMYQECVEHQDSFWAKQALKLTWTKPWSSVMKHDDKGFSKWFPGGEINVCYNLLDRHVTNGKGKKTAFYFDSALTKQKTIISYETVLDDVSRLGAALNSLGILKGCVVFIFMPKIPEAVIAALACARIGAIYSFIYGGVSLPKLTELLDYFTPSLVVTTTVGLVDKVGKPVFFKEILDQAVKSTQRKQQKTIVKRRDHLPDGLEMKEVNTIEGLDTDWDDLVNSAQPSTCVPLEVNDPVNISLTSGSTGKPKGIVHTSQALLPVVVRNELEDCADDSVLFSPKELECSPAHRLLLLKAMIGGVPSLLYEGELYAENALQILSLIDEYKVTNMSTTFRSLIDLREQVCIHCIPRKADLKSFSLKSIELVGEVPYFSVMKWLADFFGCAVSSAYGQTELSSAIGKAVAFSGAGSESPQVTDVLWPMPGIMLVVAGNDGIIKQRARQGRLLIKLPMCPGALAAVWKNEEAYQKQYFTDFPGYYDTNDEVVMADDGSFRVLGRADDTILVSGNRFMPSAIEDVVRSHPSVVECYVGPVPNSKHGQVPCALYTSKEKGCDEFSEAAEIAMLVNNTLGILVCFGGAARLQAFTKSDKLQRQMLQNILLDRFGNKEKNEEFPE